VPNDLTGSLRASGVTKKIETLTVLHPKSRPGTGLQWFPGETGEREMARGGVTSKGKKGRPNVYLRNVNETEAKGVGVRGKSKGIRWKQVTRENGIKLVRTGEVTTSRPKTTTLPKQGASIRTKGRKDTPQHKRSYIKGRDFCTREGMRGFCFQGGALRGLNERSTSVYKVQLNC